MGWKIVTVTLRFICQVDSTIDWKENQLTKLVKSQSGLKEVYTMRKCEKFGANMKSDLRLKVNGGGYGIVVRVDEKHKATTIDDVRVAVCPECGYTEMYLEDLTILKD